MTRDQLTSRGAARPPLNPWSTRPIYRRMGASGMTRDQLKKQKLNMRDLKSLTEELELLSNQFKGGMPKSVRDRLRRLEDVIKVKTAIYERVMKND